MVVNKPSDIEVGQILWLGIDERPYGSCRHSKCVITEVCDDHYLYTDIDYDLTNVWGFYDMGLCSIEFFNTENEVINWINKGKMNIL